MTRRSLLVAMTILSVAGFALARAEAATRKATLVGLVTPDDARPGERASGTLTTLPSALLGAPGVHVEKISVDLDQDEPRKAVFRGIAVKGGVQNRPADKSFVVDIPPGAKSVHLILARDEQEIAAVDVPIVASTNLPLACGGSEWIAGTEQDGSPSKFRTPATWCYAGLAVVAGDFNGDAEQTRVEVEGVPARGIAESIRFFHFLLPRTARPGRNRAVLREGSHVVTFDIIVPRLDLLQLIEDEEAGTAEAPLPDANAAASDNPAPALPLGLGIGVGEFGVGGDEGSSAVEIRRSRHGPH